jgi:predicted nucleotidyltransferase
MKKMEECATDDLFEKTIGQYLIPVEELSEGPSDAMYFLHKKGGLVYSEGYAHPPDGLFGCLIKYPDPDGHIIIFGKRFNWTHRRYENGELVIVPYMEQVRRQVELLPELATRPPCPPFADHFSHFLLSEMRGFFDGKRSLKILMESTPRLAEVVDSLDDLLGVPRERMGCNGSLAYGYFEEPQEDVDVVFYGSVKQNFEIVKRIRQIKKEEPDRECVELGRTWPLRFKHLGTVVCPFFKYADINEIPLRNFQMEVVRESVSASGVVVDDRHTGYLPALFTLDGVVIDGRRLDKPIDLIIYDGAQRGEYFNGDALRISGRLVRIVKDGGEREALLVTAPREIEKQA